MTDRRSLRLGTPPEGARAVLTTALAAFAAATSLVALGSVLAPGGWLAVGVGFVALLAVVVATVRALVRSRWAPSIVGLVVGVLAVLVRYGGTPGRLQVLPDLSSPGRVLDLVPQASDAITIGAVPLAVTRPVELLVVVGGMVVFLAMDLVAVALAAPAWSGLVLVALWVPGVALGFPASSWSVVWPGLAYLLLLALSTAPPRGRTTRAGGGSSDGARRSALTVLAACVVVLATVVAGPAVAALPGWSSLSLPHFGTGPVGPLRLSADLDLRDSLGARSGQEVLRYTVTEPGRKATTQRVKPGAGPSAAATDVTPTAQVVGPLRAFTLSTFDGSTWQRTDARAADLTRLTPDELLTSDTALSGSAPDASAGTLAEVAVQVKNLDQRELPVATFPRTVDAPGPWRYDATRDEVVGTHATTPGLTYRMTVQVPDLTADDLKNQPVGSPPDGDVDLQVPRTSHSADIAALARTITAGASTPYAQAMALQSYLRNGQEFTYDTHVATGRSGDAVWDFLTTKHGYCVQFATTMTIMARTLGLPARVGVGFLPGKPAADGSYVVTGQQSHAWPELYFADSGWVRFEPTPAIQTGAPPAWSDPYTAGGSSVEHPGEDALQIPHGAVPSAPAGTVDDDTATTSDTSSSSSWWPVAVTVLIVLALAALTVLAFVVRRRARPALTPERAWSRVRARLARAQITWDGSTTPRHAVLAVEEQTLARAGSGLGSEGLDAFERLAMAVEDVRYAPTPAAYDPADLESWIATVGRAVDELSARSRRGVVPTAPRDRA